MAKLAPALVFALVLAFAAAATVSAYEYSYGNDLEEYDGSDALDNYDYSGLEAFDEDEPEAAAGGSMGEEPAAAPPGGKPKKKRRGPLKWLKKKILGKRKGRKNKPSAAPAPDEDHYDQHGRYLASCKDGRCLRGRFGKVKAFARKAKDKVKGKYKSLKNKRKSEHRSRSSEAAGGEEGPAGEEAPGVATEGEGYDQYGRHLASCKNGRCMAGHVRSGSKRKGAGGSFGTKVKAFTRKHKDKIKGKYHSIKEKLKSRRGSSSHGVTGEEGEPMGGEGEPMGEEEFDYQY